MKVSSKESEEYQQIGLGSFHMRNYPALCCCALSLILALFVGISPISDKAKIRAMCPI